MKKNGADIPLFRNIGKILRIMKIAAVLVLVLSFHAFANSYGQTIKINLSMENVSFREIIERLEKESGYYVVVKYNQTLLDKKVNADFKNATVTDILDDLLKDTGLGYKIVDRYIAISSLSELKTVAQQQKVILGKVTDSSGASLPGVSVVVKGTTTGVITDNNGTYSLSNVPENATLQFSFVGMKMQEIVVGNKTAINVTLAEEAVGIEEVVAIGYGTMKKSDLTGAVSSIRSETINDMAVQTVGQTLRGRASGVKVTNQSGAPG
ncbi:MAG: SusC/RagA family TonB-linked outer membrane protein, partial [Mariniphaga sp.]|nr:SusC/RagA family TonB-linked outer membrane protein [Mariniphaga sp.]